MNTLLQDGLWIIFFFFGEEQCCMFLASRCLVQFVCFVVSAFPVRLRYLQGMCYVLCCVLARARGRRGGGWVGGNLPTTDWGPQSPGGGFASVAPGVPCIAVHSVLLPQANLLKKLTVVI